MPNRICMTVVFLFTCLACAFGEGAGAVRVGVFDQHSAGGSGARIGHLVDWLNAAGYQAEPMTDLHMLTLLQYDVIYLSDMHRPGRVHKDWRTTLKAFVRDGGSVLQTWHHHILGEVGVGIQRIYDSRRMHVQPGHPAVRSTGDFNASFKDHIIERVGRGATVLIKNDTGQPVAVAGTIGRGKVISTGLAIAVSRRPRGAEAALLKAFLRWLVPGVSRGGRLAEWLREPRVRISPSEVLTAAGFPALFKAQVGYSGNQKVRLTCGGADVRLEKTEAVQGADATMCTYRISVPTETRKDARYQHTVRAQVGASVFREEIAVTSVYGEPPKDEYRGVWLHVRTDRHPARVMPELKKLGINMVVLRIAGGTAAFYASKVQPDVQDPLAPDGDWLAEAVKHAHANGIEMHPYVNNCIVEGRTSEKTLRRLRAEGRLQEDSKGKPINWFCPSQEINFEAMEKVMLEIATNYDVDGIQYDFIRYPGSRGCFCAKCRARFEKETGRPVVNWPNDVMTGRRKSEWIEFRCGRISALVERISTQIRKRAPRVKISAAVFRDWPKCRENNGQDWVRWCKEGWLDFVCPMNYTLDAELFGERAAVHRRVVPEGFPIVQGIGSDSGQGAMKAPGDLAVQIALARRSGAVGFVCFCYTPKQTSALFGPLNDWFKAK